MKKDEKLTVFTLQSESLELLRFASAYSILFLCVRDGARMNFKFKTAYIPSSTASAATSAASRTRDIPS